MLGKAGKQEILQQLFRNYRSQIVFRTDILRKLTLGTPAFWRQARLFQRQISFENKFFSKWIFFSIFLRGEFKYRNFIVVVKLAQIGCRR